MLANLRVQWDEVGRLTRASRWDVSAAEVGAPGNPPPTADPVIALAYAYDAGDQRVLKTATPATGSEHTTAYTSTPSSFVERSGPLLAARPDDADYELTPTSTEVAYLFANGVRLARLAYEPPNPDNQEPVVPRWATPTSTFCSSSATTWARTASVLDKATGELVERSTYLAYGATESDYRPDRWKVFREDYKFTGKEEDIDVGLTYFGKRYCRRI